MASGNPGYIICPKYKNQPKKSVLVCRKCRWGNRCRAYQAYRQPELPLCFNGRTESRPPIPAARGGKEKVMR